MASFGKVLDLLDDRYLELQDVVGNTEPLPTLVPYEEYTQNVLVYYMDTNHEIVMGLIQDFTMQRAHETSTELWTWCVQWEVGHNPSVQQSSSPKKIRLGAQEVSAPATPRQSPAITTFERRTLDGALMLEEEMLRILIDIVQVTSALVPNFIEFLYRWVDYYEGNGKALKAALRWEIPSLWDFEYHPLVLPLDLGKGCNTKKKKGDPQSGEKQEGEVKFTNPCETADPQQSSTTKKAHTRSKPDLAIIELRTSYTEESERLQYREVKYGIQPPKLEQPLPPLINIPHEQCKRAKYYAACFKSRQRALYLLLEAGVTMRQINNYQKLQTAHPKETSEAGNGSGLRNYQKDAKYAQDQFELKEKHAKQREIIVSSKLAVEAQLAANYAVLDGAAGMPLIPPTPLYARKPDMSAAMVEIINMARSKKDERVNTVPKPLLGRMKSKIFENAREEPPEKPVGEPLKNTNCYTSKTLTRPTIDEYENTEAGLNEILNPEKEEANEDEDEEGERRKGENDNEDTDREMDADTGSEGDFDNGHFTGSGVAASTPSLLFPVLLQPSSPQPALSPSTSDIQEQYSAQSDVTTPATELCDHSTPPNIATYMQNLDAEQIQRLLPLLSPESCQAATSRLEERFWGLSPIMQEKISETAETDRSSVDEQSGSESAEDRVMCKMLSSVPYSPPLSAQIIGNRIQGRLPLVENDTCCSIIPTLLPSSASNTPTLADQQSSNGTASESVKSDVLWNSFESGSGLELQPVSNSDAAIAGFLGEDVLMPPPSCQSVQTAANTTDQRKRKQLNTQIGGATNQCFPLTSFLPTEVQQHISSGNQQPLLVTQTSVLGQSIPSPIGLQQHTTAQGSFAIPVYTLSSTSAGSVSADPHFARFSTEYFTYLRRQQEASESATSSNTLPTQPILSDMHLTSRMQAIIPTGRYQQNALRRQEISPPNSTVGVQVYADHPAQLDTQPTLQPQIITQFSLIQQNFWRSNYSVSTYRQPSQPTPSLPTPPLQSHFRFQQPTSGGQIIQTPSSIPYPPSATVMLPPRRSGIIRNAPSPLLLSPPTPSPFTTFAPHVLATSPFLCLSSNARAPVQIYFPKIIVPGNGIGPSGTKMGNCGCIETDALLLGHEDILSGKLVLSKAILLPVGMWENILRKVKNGRWSVMETYACPPNHPGKSKGKGRVDDATGRKGCHSAAYEKLVSAYGLITQAAKRREEELTKRWRVSRGPMTSHDRGAVWEGWGVFVDRAIEMNSRERRGAVRNCGEAPVKLYARGMGDGYGPHDDMEEAARRRKEMQELIDEDEKMHD